LSAELLAVLRLASPMLPIGGFSYSQGMETAIEQGLLNNETDVGEWITSLLSSSLARFELPTLARMMQLLAQKEYITLLAVNQTYIASRETAELRAETLQMGNSLLRLLQGLPQAQDTLARLPALRIERCSLPLAWSLACKAWGISSAAGLPAYAWSWAENQIAAAMKAVPLGQQAGQRLAQALQPALLAACTTAQSTHVLLAESEWSNFAPGFSIVCSQHESQYSRIFRS
jgi:urease accessory protein